MSMRRGKTRRMKHRFEIRFKDELLETCNTMGEALDAHRVYESRKRDGGFMGLIEIIDLNPADNPLAWKEREKAKHRT